MAWTGFGWLGMPRRGMCHGHGRRVGVMLTLMTWSVMYVMARAVRLWLWLTALSRTNGAMLWMLVG